MPRWVIDYLLLHELAHLIEPGHGPRFWTLLEAYPRTERALGYLEGFAAARDLTIGGDGQDDEPRDDGPRDDGPRDDGPRDDGPQDGEPQDDGPASGERTLFG
jgi:hypothetical protein